MITIHILIDVISILPFDLKKVLAIIIHLDPILLDVLIRFAYLLAQEILVIIFTVLAEFRIKILLIFVMSTFSQLKRSSLLHLRVKEVSFILQKIKDYVLSITFAFL